MHVRRMRNSPQRPKRGSTRVISTISWLMMNTVPNKRMNNIGFCILMHR